MSASSPRTLREEIRAQLALAIPLITVQLGLLMMGFVDSAFMGRVSTEEYAGVSLGHSWVFLFLVFAMGVLTSLDPIVSQAYGANDRGGMSRAVQRGVVLALVLSVPASLLVLLAEPVLLALGQPEDVVPIAGRYAEISSLSVAPFLIFVALRQSLQAMHRTAALVGVIVLANLLNAALDWVLITGKLGLPASGSVGCAWASVASRWAMVLALPLLTGAGFREYLWPLQKRSLRWSAFATMVSVGLPIGVQFLVEIGAFQAVLYLMGRMGKDEMAGHQVAMNLASFSFMVPLGISMAASVRVGTEIGRGSSDAVRRAVKVSISGGALVMVGFGLLFLSLPLPLARIITDQEEILAAAVLLIPLAGIFQVFDGVQVITCGCLRGMADTRVPMYIHLAGFWAVGIVVGSTLAFQLGRGAPGLWWGLVAGLAATALVQLWRLRVLLRRGFRRMVFEDVQDSAVELKEGLKEAEGAGG